MVMNLVLDSTVLSHFARAEKLEMLNQLCWILAASRRLRCIKSLS